MEHNWKITCLFYGTMTGPKSMFAAGLDEDKIMPFIYAGYLLQDGKQNILVDTGIHERNIIDGKAWGGCPAKGGAQYVLDALKDEGLTPEDIDIVMYTHLHNDHAGNCLLFPDTLTIVQRAEYENLMCPPPPMKVRNDYDPYTPDDFRKLTNICFIDGDLDMGNGLRLFKVPGHTLGGMAITAQTAEGRYVITGDMPHIGVSLFPKLDKMQMLDGSWVDITPASESTGPFIFNAIVGDYWDCWASFNKIKLLGETMDPKWFLTGHDMWCAVKKHFG